MSKLQIKVFGNPEVRHEGRVVKFRSRKVLALLLYLAVEGQKIAREKMSAMLWSESDETSARATLRRALADLRSALDDAPTHTHLIVERDALGFAFVSSDELDIRIVDEAMKLLRISSENTVAQYEVLRKLQQAVQVYRGRFLEGFSLNDAPDFDNWVSEQRAAWQRCMSLLYERLAQMQAEQGDVIASIETTNRWLAHDPLQERAYQHLMSLYLTQGNYRAALNVYAQCRNVLAEELHALPLPETQALAERVRRASIMRMRTEAVQPMERKKNFSGEEVSFQVALNTRMVGRSSEHLALVKSYQAIRQGQTHVTFITGEAGIGKTRLAREFLSWARMQGADILQARAFENSGRLPYQPLVESFRPRLERENAPDDLLSDTWLAELTRLFPEMRDRYPDLPVPAEDETIARMRLYEAIVRLSEAFTRKAPVVLALDDLHWADVATLDVLYYAARRWHQSHVPILLLLNLRSENLASTNSLADWMENLKRDMEVTLVHLEALPFEATLQFLETLSFDSREQSSIEQFAHWFFGETGGQPLYVTETLKALVERGMLTRYQNEDGH